MLWFADHVLSEETHGVVEQGHRLAESMRLLRPLLDHAPLGIAVFDRDLRYAYVNRVLAVIHGLSAEQHLGRTMSELFQGDHVTSVQPGVAEVLRSGVTHRDVPVVLEVDGRTRRFLINRFPLRDEDHVIAAGVTIQDLTDAHVVADVIAEHDRLAVQARWAERLEEAQRIGNLGSWEVDLTTGAVDWSTNLCRIVGVDRSPATLDAMLDLVHPSDAAVAGRFFADLAAGGPVRDTESRMCGPDGRVVVLSGVGEAVRDNSGDVVGLRGVSMDVTARREAEAQTLAAQAREDSTRVQLLAEREIVLTLQRALLPRAIPVLRCVELVAAYEPAIDSSSVGGDFYDAFVLPDGRLGVAVGDVVGHDMAAAVMMGRIRNALRAYAVRDAAPERVVGALNDLVRHDPELGLTSVFYGVYDEESGRLDYANAGHPHPVLRRAGRTAEVLTHEHGPILGVIPTSYRAHHTTLEPADVLFGYTDGLVEHRDKDLDQGTASLCEELSAPHAPPGLEHLVPLVITTVAPTSDRDDICVLALRRTI